MNEAPITMGSMEGQIYTALFPHVESISVFRTCDTQDMMEQTTSAKAHPLACYNV